MSTPLRAALVITLLVIAFGIVGNDDYEEAVRQEREYCENVRDGIWGAYRDDINCKEVLK